MSKQRYPVGIDLGTTFSSIAYVDEKDRVQTIRLDNGRLSMASAVYFAEESEIVVGTEALDHAHVEPDKVARAFKRHMGEPDWTFSAHGKEFRAEELSAMVLKKLIQQAEAEIGPIDRVVISAPFMFNEVKRRATQQAGRIAGVEVQDIVDEPVAGALAYGHTLMKSGDLYGGKALEGLFGSGTILVYDLGGGTFDLTMMKLDASFSFEVLATDGDFALGGEDWDKELSDYLAERFQNTFGVDPATHVELGQ